MEEGVFLESAVADVLEPWFVEARLHVDYSENMERELAMVQSAAQPIYVVVDPANPDEIHARMDGVPPFDPSGGFIEFLEAGRRSARPDQSASADGGASEAE